MAYQIYVRSCPDKGGKWQVSAGGGSHPGWFRDGRALFFHNLENQIMTVSFTAKGDTFSSERPRLWSSAHLADIGMNRSFDLHPDGKRIVALMPAESTGKKTETHVTILFNFLDELRRRVPVGK